MKIIIRNFNILNFTKNKIIPIIILMIYSNNIAAQTKKTSNKTVYGKAIELSEMTVYGKAIELPEMIVTETAPIPTFSYNIDNMYQYSNYVNTGYLYDNSEAIAITNYLQKVYRDLLNGTNPYLVEKIKNTKAKVEKEVKTEVTEEDKKEVVADKGTFLNVQEAFKETKLNANSLNKIDVAILEKTDNNLLKIFTSVELLSGTKVGIQTEIQQGGNTQITGKWISNAFANADTEVSLGSDGTLSMKTSVGWSNDGDPSKLSFDLKNINNINDGGAYSVKLESKYGNVEAATTTKGENSLSINAHVNNDYSVYGKVEKETYSLGVRQQMFGNKDAYINYEYNPNQVVENVDYGYFFGMQATIPTF